MNKRKEYLKRINVRFKSLAQKKIWFLSSLLFFVIILLLIAPKPWSKIELEDFTNSLDGERAFSNTISNFVSEVFSLPILFDKYDITFINTAQKECDIDLFITVEKNTDFFYALKKELDTYSGYNFLGKIGNTEYDTFKIDEGRKIIVKSYSRNKKINYFTGFGLNNDTEQKYIDETGSVFPAHDCPDSLVYDDYDVETILSFYVKPNLFNWLVSVFVLFFSSVILFGSLRTLCVNRQ